MKIGWRSDRNRSILMLRVNDEDSSQQEPCLYLSSSSSPLLRPASPLANLQCARIFPTPTAREQFSAAHDEDCDGGRRNNDVESGTRGDERQRSVRLAIQSQNKLAPRQLYASDDVFPPVRSTLARTSLRPQLQYHHCTSTNTSTSPSPRQKSMNNNQSLYSAAKHHHHPLLLFVDLRAGALNELNRLRPLFNRV
jgi:hypothetical protein